MEGGLDLIWGRYLTIPLGFAHSQANKTCAGLARGAPLGAQLDLYSLGHAGNYLPWPGSQGGAL